MYLSHSGFQSDSFILHCVPLFFTVGSLIKQKGYEETWAAADPMWLFLY